MRRFKALLLAALMLTVISTGALAAAPAGSTPISNELSATITAEEAAPAPPFINLTWDLGTEQTVRVGDGNNVTVTATLTEDGKRLRDQGGIQRVLYVLEVTKDGQAATPDQISIVAEGGQSLGYDTAEGFWFWGPRTGFTWDSGMGDSAQTTFTYTINEAGSYSVKLYAVQLPEASGGTE